MKFQSLLFTTLVTVLGFGQISFTATNVLTFTNAPRDLGSGDFVAGGNKELLVITSSGYGENITGNQNLKQISLDNSGVISSTNLTYNGTNPLSLETGDFNGDGYDDAIFSGDCNCSYAGLFLGSQNGLVATSTSLSYSRFTYDISSGYILNNTKSSIATGGNGGIQVNTATGTANSLSFSTFYDALSGTTSSTGFAIGDMNNDGLGDVLAAWPIQGNVLIFYSQANSPYFVSQAANSTNQTSFVESIALTTSGYSGSVNGLSVGDIDGDGILEIAAIIKPTGGTSTQRAIAIIKKGVNNIYSVVQTIAINSGSAGASGWVKLVDMNSDGKADIICGDDVVKVFLAGNNGLFSSTPSNSLNAFAGQDRVEIRDFNNDNLLDIAAIGQALKQVVIYLQTPKIIINSSTLTNFSTCFGNASSSQSVTIQGSNLGSVNITVTAPSDYEISLSSSSNFGQSLTLTQTNGSVPPTTIFIRLKSTASVVTATVNLTAVSGSNSSNVALTGTVTGTYTWTGTTSTDPTVAGNWNPAAVPCSGANEVIPSGLTNYPVYTNLTINSGTTLTVQSGGRLTVNGTLTNDGTLTIQSGATLVQGASSTLAGSGTYNVQQAITGAGSTTPSGRFWYLGSPVSLASSSVYFGNAANVVKKRDEATNAWVALVSGTPENLVVGKGYYTQAMANSTINFTGGLVNNGAITISGLTRTAGQNFEGFNLVANPYPSYLDWDAVTKTDVGNTMWYRTFNSTNNTMVFDTYVAGTGGIGTNLNGAGVSNLIPPMQSFWVRVNANANSSLNNTGSLGLTNSMRAHFTSINGSTAGLKSTSNERDLFLRMNLLQADKKDQIIVYVNEIATNGFDQFDGEKMMQAGMPQFYTSAAGKKITINGLNSAKKQQALPITMELPFTGVHSFVIEDLEISNGLVWLEDKQEEIMQALEPGTVYEFYANSGINAERFVLHFQLIDNTTPINVYNEVNSSANFSGKGASVHAESAGVVVIKLPASTEGITDIQIRDAAGKLVYTGSTNTLETSVQLEKANGIYYVTLNSASGVEVRKVFIQQ